MRHISAIVIHCSASPNGRGDTIEDIDRWHKERGFHRGLNARQQFNPELESVGYHYVIETDGGVKTGRHLEEVGAHAAGANAFTIGICMVGTDAFSPAQWLSLSSLVKDLQAQHPEATVIGHRDLPNVAKSCPGFDVRAWSETA